MEGISGNITVNPSKSNTREANKIIKVLRDSFDMLSPLLSVLGEALESLSLLAERFIISNL